MNQTQQKFNNHHLVTKCQGKGRICIHGDALILETMERGEVNGRKVWGSEEGRSYGEPHMDEAEISVFFF